MQRQEYRILNPNSSSFFSFTLKTFRPKFTP